MSAEVTRGRFPVGDAASRVVFIIVNAGHLTLSPLAAHRCGTAECVEPLGDLAGAQALLVPPGEDEDDSLLFVFIADDEVDKFRLLLFVVSDSATADDPVRVDERKVGPTAFFLLAV